MSRTEVRRAREVPVTVAVCVALTALEALAFLVYGLALLPALLGDRPEAGSTALFFFLVYAALLAACARALWRLRSWARAPVVLAQLLQLILGFGFWGGGTTLVAVVLIAVAVTVLVTLLHPRSLAAIGSGA